MVRMRNVNVDLLTTPLMFKVLNAIFMCIWNGIEIKVNLSKNIDKSDNRATDDEMI